MKYDITLHRTETRDLQFSAGSPQEAIERAIADNPGFTTDTATEIDEHGEPMEDHVKAGSCEACGKWFWEGKDEYESTDDGSFCPECYEAMITNIP